MNMISIIDMFRAALASHKSLRQTHTEYISVRGFAAFTHAKALGASTIGAEFRDGAGR
jgi:hypothetical protein